MKFIIVVVISIGLGLGLLIVNVRLGASGALGVAIETEVELTLVPALFTACAIRYQVPELATVALKFTLTPLATEVNIESSGEVNKLYPVRELPPSLLGATNVEVIVSGLVLTSLIATVRLGASGALGVAIETAELKVPLPMLFMACDLKYHVPVLATVIV